MARQSLLHYHSAEAKFSFLFSICSTPIRHKVAWFICNAFLLGWKKKNTVINFFLARTDTESFPKHMEKINTCWVAEPALV